jgi:NADH pyrophosphatase NudC (nudix superfamily)
MPGHCPGQDGRELKVTVRACPSCGSEVEMFSDEIRVKCQNCGKYVCSESMPTCIEWCAKARECVGEERWEQLGRGKG